MLRFIFVHHEPVINEFGLAHCFAVLCAIRSAYTISFILLHTYVYVLCCTPEIHAPKRLFVICFPRLLVLACALRWSRRPDNSCLQWASTDTFTRQAWALRNSVLQSHGAFLCCVIRSCLAAVLHALGWFELSAPRFSIRTTLPQLLVCHWSTFEAGFARFCVHFDVYFPLLMVVCSIPDAD
jgi:hypothetical protein